MRRYSLANAMEHLNAAGIPIREYKRPLMGKNLFTIGIGRRYTKNESIYLWPGLVTHADIAVNKKLGQAVMTVLEKEQTHTFTGRVNSGNCTRQGEPLPAVAANMGIYSPVILPENATCTDMELLEVFSTKDTWYPYRKRKVSRVKFTVLLPEEERHFLLGYDTDLDGKRTFISMMRKKAETVEEAHENLRPKSVPEGALRQGEFFFLPAPKYIPESGSKLRESAIRTNWRRNPALWQRERRPRIASMSDHFASELVVNPKARVRDRQFVRGIIKNRRHEPLVLEIWHRVVPNLEVPNPRPERTTYD